MVLSQGKSNIILIRETTFSLNCIPYDSYCKIKPAKYTPNSLGYHLTILWLVWNHSSSATRLPHNFYTEICKACCGIIRYGVVPIKLKSRHLTLKQDLQGCGVINFCELQEKTSFAGTFTITI